MDRKVYDEWLDGLASGKHSLRLDEYKKLSQTKNGGILKKWMQDRYQEKERAYIKNTGKNGPCHVDAKLMNSKKYHDKFEGLTKYKAVNESLYIESLKILSDNNDTELEHIVAINAKTGKVLAKNTDAVKMGMIHQCGFSIEQRKYLKSLDTPFEALHNHPNSSLPSRDDILKLFQRKNQAASTIACHNGTVHRLAKLKDVNIDSLFEKIYHDTKVRYQGFSERTIETICSESLIKTLMRKGYLEYVKK